MPSLITIQQRLDHRVVSRGIQANHAEETDRLHACVPE